MNNVKVIILAAGRGSRMKDLTLHMPKCLLKFNGETILETQINLYRQMGIQNIVVVKGYLEHLIKFNGLKYYIAPEGFNMLYSLFCAEPELNGEIIISYGDIIFEEYVVSKILSDNHDMSVVVDIQWESYFRARFGNPYLEAESLIFSSNNQIIEIGKPHPLPEETQAQYIGLIKLSENGCSIFRKIYHLARMSYSGKPWQRATVFERAYMTDMLQAVIDSGYKIYGVPIYHGWLEFDTTNDYKNYLEWKETGKLFSFYKASHSK
ncbi:MAG: phosphocholine cytidylyltransferase family protein [bacterium]